MLNNINDLLLVAGQQEGGYEPYHEVLEYVKLDGTQYFNPDLLTNADYTIEARFKLTDTSSSSSVFGGRNSSSNPMNGNQLHYIYTNGKTQYIGGYSTAELAVDNAITVNDVCEVVCDKTGFSIAKNGGTPTKHSKAFSAVQYTTDLMIGATYTKTGNSIQWGFRGEYYTFKVRLNGELIRDYIPALDSQLRPCLYDRVSKTFLYAKKISGGATTYDLGFKRWNKYDVDYIQSSGTQYINTGYKPTKDTSFDLYGVDMDYASATTRFGSRTGTYSETFVLATIADSHFRWSYGTGSAPATTDNVFDTQKKAKQISWDATTKKCTITFTDDTTETSVQMRGTDLTSNAIPVYLFAFNSVGEPICGEVKHTRIVFREGDVIVRDFKPVVWHNGDTTAEACLYDEVYNKMYPNLGTGSLKAYIDDVQVPYTLAQHDNMDIQLGTGAYINASGVVTTDTASCYTKAIPVSAGDVITLTVTGRATTSVFNKRIHAYTADDGTISVGSKGSWVSQLGYITFPIGQTNYTTQTLSVTIPSGVNYIRLSHALRTGDDVILETQCDITITRPYEVGTYIQTIKSSTVQTTGYVINLGIEPKDGIGYHIKTSTNVNSSNYVFGARKGTSIPSQQSNKPILVGLTGSQTGGTVLSSVMGASATWASDGTNWVRPSSSTSSYVYECSMQTYKENNELKFNVIGYNYTLAKNADKQTLTYTDAINNADEADMSTLHIGGLNVNNILNGNNAYFFIECRQPNTDMTLLPVVNNNQFYFIDNKTKQTYQFYKVGSPTPTTDNIRIKKLDGTFIDGTL